MVFVTRNVLVPQATTTILLIKIPITTGLPVRGTGVPI